VATPPSRPLDAVLSPSPFEADGCDIRAEEIPASLPGCWVGHRAIHCLCWLYGGRRGLVPRAISQSSLVAGGPGVRTASVQDYFQRRCEQQPSPNARETRPPRGRVFRFLRSVFEGWARAAGAAVSRGLHHVVARLPRWPTEWAESLSGSLAAQGAGLRLGRPRWSGHYPRGRPRWFGPEPLRIVTRR